jgi:hypothetical protein
VLAAGRLMARATSAPGPGLGGGVARQRSDKRHTGAEPFAFEADLPVASGQQDHDRRQRHQPQRPMPVPVRSRFNASAPHIARPFPWPSTGTTRRGHSSAAASAGGLRRFGCVVLCPLHGVCVRGRGGVVGGGLSVVARRQEVEPPVSDSSASPPCGSPCGLSHRIGGVVDQCRATFQRKDQLPRPLLQHLASRWRRFPADAAVDPGLRSPSAMSRSASCSSASAA